MCVKAIQIARLGDGRVENRIKTVNFGVKIVVFCAIL